MSAHSTGPLNIQASPATYGGIVPYHKSSIPGLYSYQGQQGRVTVFSGGGFQGVGAGSPTKSMSSGLLLITLWIYILFHFLYVYQGQNIMTHSNILGSMSNANAGQTIGIATSSSFSSDGLLLGNYKVG